jgi:hypothetical protein
MVFASCARCFKVSRAVTSLRAVRCLQVSGGLTSERSGSGVWEAVLRSERWFEFAVFPSFRQEVRSERWFLVGTAGSFLFIS